MKMHVRILYAVAVAVLVTAGFSLKTQNDELATKVAVTSTPTAAAPASGGTP